MNQPQTQSNPKNPQRASRIKLVLIILLFAGPLAVAFLSYYGNLMDFSLRGQSNHAPLINPAVTLKSFENQSLSGEVLENENMGRMWSFFHIVDGQCDDSCKQALYQTRQTRLAVGKDIKRLKRYIVIMQWDDDSKNPDPESLVGQIRTNHPDAMLLKPGQSGVEVQILEQLNEQKAGGNDAILTDPLGNMMMVVPLELDPRLLLKDMKKLLKLSNIG